jgi:hypothetical membrane protein
MNISLIVVGLAMGLGVLLFLGVYKTSKIANISFACLGLTGLLTALIGFFPENQFSLVHYLIAAIGLTIFNFSVLIAYWISELPGPWRWYSLVMGVIGLSALIMLGLNYATPIGAGGLERVADYTPDIWVLSFGTYILLRPKLFERRAFTKFQ